MRSRGPSVSAGSRRLERPGAGNPGGDLSSRPGGELGASRLASVIHQLLGVEALRSSLLFGDVFFSLPFKSIVSFENVSKLK